MNTDMELPADVLAELRANRRITAIKLLRAHQGIGLKEAKEVVDVYLEKHPASTRPQAPETEGGDGRILILIIGVGIIYGLYAYLDQVR